MWLVHATAVLSRAYMASLRASQAAFDVAAGIALQSLREPELDALAAAIYDSGTLHRSERIETWEERWWSAALPAQPGTVLVAGCGAGRELQWLAARGWHVSAFDPAPTLVSMARRRVPGANIDVGDFASFVRAQRAGSFDAVLIGFGAFSHCLTRTSRRALLDACASACPSGPILLSWQASGGRAGRARRVGDRIGGALGALRGVMDDRDDLVLLPHAGPTCLVPFRDVEELAAGIGRSVVGGEAPMPHASLVVRSSNGALVRTTHGRKPAKRRDPMRGRGHADLAEVATDLLEDVLRERGTHRLVARGSSMRPAIRDGATLVLRATDEVAFGDVVAARIHGALVVHRVVGVDARGALLLQGDACPAPDGWVERRDVLGVVVTSDAARVPMRTSSAQRAQIVQVLKNAARRMGR